MVLRDVAMATNFWRSLGYEFGCIIGSDTLFEVGHSPGHNVLDGDLAPPKTGAQPPPNFRPMSIVAKRLDGPRCHLVRR